MTAKKAKKKKSGVKDLKPRSIKSGGKEAGSIKGGFAIVKHIDKASPKLYESL